MLSDLSRVLDSLLDGVIVVDAEGRFEQLNTEACRILETSTDAVAGRPVEQVAGAAPFAAAVRAVLAGAPASVEREARVTRRFQGELLVEATVAPCADEDGRVLGAVVGLRDLTLGAALREVERERAGAAALGQIASGIAHEVRNPLGGIRGAAELLGRRAPTDRDRAAADLIMREVDRIAALLDDFLVFGRAGELRLSRVNLHRVLDDVLDVLAVDPLGAGVEVERSFDPSIPEFDADPDRLVQVFLNLGRNALEAMQDREGTLRIATRLRLDHRIDLGAGERVPRVAVEFADTGCGVPEAVRDRVGTPFFTTKARGTGLGLALARHFVTQHGGTLQIESDPGSGTRVRVSVPLRRGSSPGCSEHAGAEPAQEVRS